MNFNNQRSVRGTLVIDCQHHTPYQQLQLYVGESELKSKPTRVRARVCGFKKLVKVECGCAEPSTLCFPRHPGLRMYVHTMILLVVDSENAVHRTVVQHISETMDVTDRVHLWQFYTLSDSFGWYTHPQEHPRLLMLSRSAGVHTRHKDLTARE
jgi:hypothetical protein